MADDQQNPFTMMGMMQMMQPNPYTQYGQGQRLPIPGYMGTPTDAQGNPIQSFTDAQAAHDAWTPPTPGTTLNSTPQSNIPQYTFSPGGDLPSGENYGSSTPTHFQGGIQTNPAYAIQQIQQQAQQGQQAPQAAAPTNPVDMRQAYLTALSNPGKVTTPGANVPQAQPLGTPSVLNSFLAANPGGGGAGAGGYNNQGFFSTLNKLRAS